MNTNVQVKAVRNYMSAGLASVMTCYGREDYDQVMNRIIIPGFAEILRTKTDDAAVSELAEIFDQMAREYPEAFAHMILMAVSLGIGFGAMEEIR